MSEIRSELERIATLVRPNADAFERLERRRRRRTRNRRIGTALVVLALAAAGGLGGLATLGRDRANLGTGREVPFVPIWPETSYADAVGAQEAYASGFGTVPSWRGDAEETATRFARTALGWRYVAADLAGAERTADGTTRVTVATPAVPCPSPPPGESIPTTCRSRSAVVELRRVTGGGIWTVVGVAGDRLGSPRFERDANDDATSVSIGTRSRQDPPGDVLQYVAVTGVGGCRDWESDSLSRASLPLREALPTAPADRPDGCGVVVVVLTLPADAPSPRNLGQAVLFAGRPPVQILDAAAAPAHIPPGDAALAPTEGRLEIRCEGDIALDRDSVSASPEGVHLVVVNGVADTPVTFELSPARDGDVPVSSTELRGGDALDRDWTLAPGRYVATCRYPRAPAGAAHSASVSFMVTDPSGVYVDPSLECEGGAIYEVTPPPTTDPSVLVGDPLGSVVAHLEGLGDDDALSRAGGYPRTPPTIVTITRNGHVVGSVSFFDDANGQTFVDTIRGCAGTTFSWNDRGG
jgi:hypothetical protein